MDVPNLKAHHKKLQEQAKLKQAQDLISQRQAVNAVFPGLTTVVQPQQQQQQQLPQVEGILPFAYHPVHNAAAHLNPSGGLQPQTAAAASAHARAELKRKFEDSKGGAKPKRQSSAKASVPLVGGCAANDHAAGLASAVWPGASILGGVPSAAEQVAAQAVLHSAAAVAAISTWAWPAAGTAQSGPATAPSGQAAAGSSVQNAVQQEELATAAGSEQATREHTSHQKYTNRSGANTKKCCAKCHGLWSEHVAENDAGGTVRFAHGANLCLRHPCPGQLPEDQDEYMLNGGDRPLCSKPSCRYYHEDKLAVYRYMQNCLERPVS